MNNDVIEFFERNGIDKDLLSNLEESYIYEAEEVNSLVATNGFHDKMQNLTKISVANIVGYDRSWRGVSSNLLDSIDFYFNSEGKTYQQRSVGLLTYSTYEVIKELKDVCSDQIEGDLHKSFEIEPICVQEIDKDKYVISTNGLHRFTMLKIHYLKELAKINGDKEKISELNNKFTIPVMVSKLDYIKTYSKVLLNLSNSVNSIQREYDEKYNLTGRVSIKDKENNNFLLNNEQLVQYTKQKVGMVLDNQYFLQAVEFYSTKYESFRQFISENIPILNIEKTNKEAGVK